MASDPRIDFIIDRLLDATRLASEQQAQIRALIAYLNEQPLADASRLGKLLQQERARLKQMRASAASPEAFVLALLEDFEGPLQ